MYKTNNITAYGNLHPNAQKQQMLEQMQTEKELGRRIRGLQREKHKKPQRSESSKARVSFSGNPNGGSDSEHDVNMYKRAVHSDGESILDKGRKGVNQIEVAELKHMILRPTKKSISISTRVIMSPDTLVTRSRRKAKIRAVERTKEEDPRQRERERNISSRHLTLMIR